MEIYDDHEQGARVQQWLKENGGAIVMGVVLAIGLLFGWDFWNNRQDNMRMGAAAEFRALTSALEGDNLDAAVSNFETIKAEYPKSAYSALAALAMARARLDADQDELAVSHLEFAIEHGEPDTVRDIGRERLARVLIGLGDFEGAEAQLKQLEKAEGMASRVAEIRGDLLLAQGDNDAARAAYQQALDSTELANADRSILQLKLDDLSAIDAAAQATPATDTDQGTETDNSGDAS